MRTNTAPIPAGDDEAAAPVAKERPHLHMRKNATPQGRTIRGRQLSRAERRVSQLAVYPPDVERPRTRGDCQGGQRPCPWVSCAHHVYLDVNVITGAVKLNFPHLEVDELEVSCVLDVADGGPVTLERAGRAINVTRERVRQIEEGIIDKVTRRARRAGVVED